MLSSRQIHKIKYAIGFSLAATVLLSGCSGNHWGFPYRVPVQQGNWVTQQQVGLLYQGMTREQVRFALGSPTLTNVLHANRWDYPYYFVSPNGQAELRNFSVFFDGDFLVKWEGDTQPTVEPFQIAKEEVQLTQKEQAEIDLIKERQGSSDSINVAPGVSVSLDNQILPSTDPYDEINDPTAAPIELN